MSVPPKTVSAPASHRVGSSLRLFVSAREKFLAMKGVLCLALVSLFIVISLSEGRESSENSAERTQERDSKDVDSVDADRWPCKGKRRNQLCDGGEGRCVWARRAKRMVCVEINREDDDRESKEN